MFAQKLLVGLIASTGLVAAAPAPALEQRSSPYAPVQVNGNPDKCPGYDASNVVKSGSGLTADLTLKGDGCTAYGKDIKNLKLEVEYQNGACCNEYLPAGISLTKS
jgi:alpha-glucosidase